MANVVLNIISKFDNKGIEGAKGALGKLGPIAKGVGAGLAGVGAIAAAGFGAAAVEVVSFGNETNQAMETFAARTGTAASELDGYKDIALAVFAGPPPLGESVEDVAIAMADVESVTGLAGDKLQDATSDALTFSQRFDQDLNEALRTADSLVKNNLAPNFDSAFDIMSKGIQEGLDKSGDLLGTLDEYAQDFDALGFTAGDTLNLINRGLDAGIFNTDKIGDALNEAFINLKDPAVIEKLGELDSGLGDIAARYASGELSGKDAFNETIAGLEAIEDPLARNEAGVQVFRSLWEDLGEDAILALDGVNTGFEDIEGATERAGQQATDLGALWEGTMRQLRVNTEPIAQELLPILSEAILSVSGFFQEAQPVFDQFASNLSDTIGPATLLIGDALTRIGIALGIAEEGSSGTDVAMTALAGTLDLVVTGLEALAISAQAIAWLVEKGREAVDIFKDLAGQFEVISAFAQTNPLDVAAATAGALGIPGFQHGGDFVVPPGFDNDSFLMAVSSGERVTVQPQGGGGGVNVPPLNMSGIDAQAIVNAVAEKYQRQINQALTQYTNTLVQQLGY